MLILAVDRLARRHLAVTAEAEATTQAIGLVRSGVQYARARLLRDAADDVRAGQRVDTLTDVWATPLERLEFGGGYVSLSIVDERSKLNLNDLASQSKARNDHLQIDKAAQFRRLFRSLGVDDGLVDVMMDWMDEDDLPRPMGAESAYYGTLNPAYSAANRPLRTLEELLLLKGMTPQTLKALTPYVSVFNSEGNGWINLNTAPRPVIEALDRRMVEGAAEALMRARPFRSEADVDRASDLMDVAKGLRLAQAYRLESDRFSITVTGQYGAVVKQGHAVVSRERGTTTALSLVVN
jgi:general secretion pathway protein K